MLPDGIAASTQSSFTGRGPDMGLPLQLSWLTVCSSSSLVDRAENRSRNPTTAAVTAGRGNVRNPSARSPIRSTPTYGDEGRRREVHAVGPVSKCPVQEAKRGSLSRIRGRSESRASGRSGRRRRSCPGSPATVPRSLQGGERRDDEQRRDVEEVPVGRRLAREAKGERRRLEGERHDENEPERRERVLVTVVRSHRTCDHPGATDEERDDPEATPIWSICAAVAVHTPSGKRLPLSGDAVCAEHLVADPATAAAAR